MSRIRWYGPTVVLLLTVLVVMISGPRLSQQIAHAHKTEEIRLIQQSLAESTVLEQLSESFRNIARVVEPSVVHIQVSRRGRAAEGGRSDLLERFFGPNFRDPMERFRRGERDERQQEEEPGDGEDLEKYNPLQPYGTGSGWVYDDKGHIITNNHVVMLRDGKTVADEIRVKFNDGSERVAKLVAADAKTDIAVLKVEGPVHPARLAGKAVEQGDMVFAFGSPFGRFDFSMSQGIVSAKGRKLEIIRGGYENFIQTDAAINPGNSGGPLTNIYGEVVGMNTAIASRTGAFNGIGFAIPIGMVKDIANEIIAKGKVTRGYLGVYIDDLTPAMARSFGYEGKGVLVRQPIPGSPGDKAGIQPGDIIVAVEGQKVENADELRNLVATFSPGSKIKIDLVREEKPITVTATVTELPDQVAQGPGGGTDAEASPSQEGTVLLRKLGLEHVATFTEQLAARTRIPFTPGVLIENVREGSAAFIAGLRPGIVITHVMREQVDSVDGLIKELNKHDLTQGVRIRITMNGVSSFVLLELPKE